MYPVSARFFEAVRHGGKVVARVEAWIDGELAERAIPIIGGSVAVTGAKTGVHRTLSLTTERGHEELMAHPLLELRPYRGFAYTHGAAELVPLGRFTPDTSTAKLDGDGNLTVSAPDPWAKVVEAKLEKPVTTAGGAAAEAVRLTREAFTSQPDAVNTVTVDVDATDALWEGDRDKAIQKLVENASAELFFTVDGKVLCRNQPTLDQTSVWLADASPTGVLTAASREYSRQRIFNVIIVVPADVDGYPPFEPVTVQDDNPNSPTWVGKFRKPLIYSSALIADARHAAQVGVSLLEKYTARARRLTLSAVPNPALETGDVITVRLPDGSISPRLVDGFTIPLLVGEAMPLTTRADTLDED